MNDKTQLTERDQDAVAGRDGDASRRMTMTPAVDVFEDSQCVTLWADLPGVSRDKLEVRGMTAVFISKQKRSCRPLKACACNMPKCGHRDLHVPLR
jgi:HSP20 family molecular chaperone IbpA